MDDDRVPRGQRPDLIVGKSQIQQRDTLTSRREQRPLVNVTHRFDSQRIACHDHFALGGQDRQTIGTVKLGRRFSQDLMPFDSITCPTQ